MAQPRLDDLLRGRINNLDAAALTVAAARAGLEVHPGIARRRERHAHAGPPACA